LGKGVAVPNILFTKIVGHAALCPTYAEAALIGASALTATADFKLLLAGSITASLSRLSDRPTER
jgi:hypothetical protein